MKTSIQPISRDGAALIEGTEPIGPDGFAVVYRHYKPMVVRYATFKGARDPEGIADLALLSGFKAINNLETRTPDTFGYYLTRAVIGHIADERRANGRNADLELHEDTDFSVEVIEDPSEQLVDIAWLHELVAELPPDQRDVIQHRFFADLTGSETGHQLNKDPNAVYQLQHRALRNLRRTIFAAVLAATALIASIAGLRAWQPSLRVDSSPASETDNPAPDGGDQTPATSVPPRQLEGHQSDAGQTNGAIGVFADADADTNEPEISAPPTVASTEPEGQTSQPITDPTAQTSATTNNPAPETPPTTPIPTTTLREPATTTSTAAPLQASTPLNACYPHLISRRQLAVSLYNPESDHGRAATFRPPESVRFLDPAGVELHRVNTSGPMVTGLGNNSHGWMGDGNGTFAQFDQAPTPTYWGVLVEADLTSGWATIQALNPADQQWQTVPGCN